MLKTEFLPSLWQIVKKFFEFINVKSENGSYDNSATVTKVIGGTAATFAAMSVAPQILQVVNGATRIFGGGKGTGPLSVAKDSIFGKGAAAAGNTVDMWNAAKLGAGLANSSMTQANGSPVTSSGIGGFLQNAENTIIGTIFGLKNKKQLTSKTSKPETLWKNVLKTADQITAAKSSGGLFGMLKGSSLGQYGTSVANSVKGLHGTNLVQQTIGVGKWLGQTAKNGVGGIASSLAGIFGGPMQNAMNSPLGNFITSIGQKAVGLGKGAVGGVKNFAGNTLYGAKTLAGNIASSKVGQTAVKIGGGAKVSVQSMLNIPSTDIEGSVRQAKELEAAGCEIIRAAIPNKDAVKLIPALKEAVSVPIVADIHFDYKLALEACAAGIDKIRINPGNIGSDDRVKAVADACRQRGIPIRIGVNSGSLEKEILAKYGHPTPEALCDSALYHASLLEKFDFNDIVLSMKSSTVSTMIKAYELAAERCDYPLHLGVTEAGTERMGIIKSSAGIGALLLHGIGDTIRVSLTADPVKEVYAAHDILKALDIEKDGVQFVSCPTCGRTRIDLVKIANEVEDKLRNCKKNIKVAVMGCVVNGPGEAREADIGIAGGDGCGLVFKKGEILRKVPEDKLVDALLEEVEKL